MQGERDSRGSGISVFAVLWLVFFFHAMAPGAWMPALTNILGAKGLAAWVPVVFAVIPVFSMISPVLGGALADQRIPANVLFGWCSLVSGVALALAFGALDAGLPAAWFVGLMAFAAFASAPTWGLLATISLANLKDSERQYPRVRVAGTLGWVAGGLLTSYVLRADASPVAGYAAAVIRLAASVVAFRLPHTPPLGRGGRWRSRLGFDAFALLKQRDHAVFFGVTALFSIPLAAFYMYAPEFLKVLGEQRPAGTMTVAQVLEVVSMFLVGAAMTRYRVKVVLLWALGLSALRFGLSGWAGATGWVGWHVAGIALHGVCYTFYFITAQVFLERRVEVGLRGQAQGLLSVMSAGVGPVAGALICGWLRETVVHPDGTGWDVFWFVLAGMVALCFGLFAGMYRGRRED